MGEIMVNTFYIVRNRLTAVVAAGMLAVFCASEARAANEFSQLYAYTCSPYIVGGCATVSSLEFEPRGVNVGGAYAFASGWNGGFAIASAVFYPGAPSLLAAGIYQNGSVGSFSYTFQVQGKPDTYVPLHVSAILSISPFHLTDTDGAVATLVNGVVADTPNPRFTKIVGSAGLQVIDTHPTTNAGSNGLSASIESIYQGQADAESTVKYCRGCTGNSKVIDQTILVWSNSNINVRLGASAFIEYRSGGMDVSPTFGNMSAEVDPVFSIDDPAFSGFSIVGVPAGVPPPNMAAVPEPASWALMFCGLGLMGGAALRRQ
jgi:hypothetical protein